MNFFERFKSLPVSSRRLLGIGVILALAVALPLFIWAVVTQRFLIIKHAASGEPGVCVAQNKTIIVTPESDINGTCHNIQTAVDAVTGDGYTVQIQQGSYNVSSTINVTGKSNITIRGGQSSGDVGINFNSGGWGFLVSSSSGSIQMLTASGSTSNGLLSIIDSSNFNVAYSNLYATASHTMDIQRSNNINIYNTEIQSSAGALEVDTSNTVHIMNNKIHNSTNAISVNNSENIEILGNLIYANNESGVRLYNVTNLATTHNTLYNNAENGTYSPAVYATGNVSGSIQISKNLIVFNHGDGIKFNGTSSNLSGYFNRNDIYGNYNNYVGVPNQTGINGNISQNPLLNPINDSFCLQSGSPAIYGNMNSGEYMGYIGPCGTNPPPTPTPTPTPSADCFTCNQNNQCVFDAGCQMSGTRCGNGASCTAIPTPPPTVRPFQILLKLDGVTGDAANLAKVTVRFISKVLDNTLGYTTPPIPIIYNGNGVYRLNFGIWSTFLPASTDYALVIKGEKHIGMKFCEPTGQTTHCLTSGGGYILLPANPLNLVSLDFTRIPLEPGDLPPQDGVANAQDIAKINELLSKPCSSLTDQERMTADLDYNGCVNIRDAFLMRKALETRYDEN